MMFSPDSLPVTLWQRWRLAVGAGLVFLVLLTPLLGRKQGYTVDATPAFQLTQTIVETGDLFPEVAVKQGYLYSVVYIPFYLGGSLLAPLFPDVPTDWVQRKMLCWMNVCITAATIMLVVQMLVRLGYRAPIALGVGWLYGFTTMAFVYARTDYNKALAALLVMATLYGWMRWWQTGRISHAVLSGIAGGLMLMVRAELGIMLVILGLGTVLSGQKTRWKALAVLVLLPAAGASFVLLYNRLYWEGAAAGGYEGGFVLNPVPGMLGFLVSPGKSLLVFCPVLLFVPLGVRLFVQQNARFGWVWAGCTLAIFLLYSFWGNWWGGWGYGPRHLVPLVPLMMLPLAEVMARAKRSHWWSLAILAVVGALVQWGGTIIDFNDVILMLVRSGASVGITEPEMMQAIIWDLSTNPVLYHLAGIVQVPVANWDIGWVYVANRFGILPAVFFLLIWVALIVVLAVRTVRRALADPTD